MNVGELRTMLEQYPDDMEILNERHSDYGRVLRSDWSVVMAVPNSEFWVMRSHDTMSAENKALEKAYLHLSGN